MFTCTCVHILLSAYNVLSKLGYSVSVRTHSWALLVGRLFTFDTNWCLYFFSASYAARSGIDCYKYVTSLDLGMLRYRTAIEISMRTMECRWCPGTFDWILVCLIIRTYTCPIGNLVTDAFEIDPAVILVAHRSYSIHHPCVFVSRPYTPAWKHGGSIKILTAQFSWVTKKVARVKVLWVFGTKLRTEY
jgi:hypothetical protein